MCCENLKFHSGFWSYTFIIFFHIGGATLIKLEYIASRDPVEFAICGNLF